MHQCQHFFIYKPPCYAVQHYSSLLVHEDNTLIDACSGNVHNNYETAYCKTSHQQAVHGCDWKSLWWVTLVQTEDIHKISCKFFMYTTIPVMAVVVVSKNQTDTVVWMHNLIQHVLIMPIFLHVSCNPISNIYKIMFTIHLQQKMIHLSWLCFPLPQPVYPPFKNITQSVSKICMYVCYLLA